MYLLHMAMYMVKKPTAQFLIERLAFLESLNCTYTDILKSHISYLYNNKLCLYKGFFVQTTI